MENEKQIVAEIGFADGEIRQYEDSKEFLKDLDAATKENAYDTNFRVYAESDELKRKAADVKLDNYDPIEASERMHNGYEWNDVEHEAVQFTQSAEGRRLLKEAENGRLTMLDARDILDAVEKNGMNLRYDPLQNSYVVDGWTAADGEKLDNYIVSMSELKRLAGIEILENSQQNQFQEKENPRTPEEKQAYQEWEEMLDDNQTAEEQIEKMQVNGGMSEAAMEADIAAEENPRPDYIDEQGNPHWFDEEEPEEPVDMSGYEFAEYIHSPDFIDKFGDWEKANRLEKLENSPIIEVDFTIIDEGKDITEEIKNLRNNPTKENIKKLRNIGQSIGAKFLNTPFDNLDTNESTIFVNNTKIQETTSHHIKETGVVEALYHLPELIKNGILIQETINEDKQKHPEIEKYQYLIGGFKVGEQEYTAKTVISVDKQGRKFYDQRLSSIEKGNLIDLLKKESDSKNFSRLTKSREFETASYNYDTRLFRVCQIPQFNFLERNEITGKWQPTMTAVNKVKNGTLILSKDSEGIELLEDRESNISYGTNLSGFIKAIKTAREQSKNSQKLTASDTLEQKTLNNASDLLKNMQFTPENYKKLLNVINEISEMNGLKNLAIPKEEEIVSKKDNHATFKDVVDSVSETKVGETLKTIAEHGAGLPEDTIDAVQAVQNKIYENIHGEQNQNVVEKETSAIQKQFDPKDIVFGETVFPTFSFIDDGKLKSIENAIVMSFDKEKQRYLIDNGTEKMELSIATVETFLNDKLEQEKQKARLIEGKTIVFEDKERGVNGTEIPEWAMYTANGLESFKGFVPTKFNEVENTYTLSNGDQKLTVTAERFKEITAPERFENKFDENSPAWKKLCETQYNDFFQQRDNIAYNFRHNLAVYCRKEANSPCDALHLAKEIISRMSKEEQKQTQKLLKSMAHENETTNELIARIYHESIKEIPLNEDYMKTWQPQKVIARPFYDTISDEGKKVDNDPALVKGSEDRNLKIGMSLKNVEIETGKLFGKGKDTMYFDELKVISASKEGNSITLMDRNKSYIKLPRDTVLNYYKEQQLREMKHEYRQNRSNTMSFGYA